MRGTRAPQAQWTITETTTRLPPLLTLTGKTTLAPLMFQGPAACIISPVTPVSEGGRTLEPVAGPSQPHTSPTKALAGEEAPTTLRSATAGGTVDTYSFRLGKARGPFTEQGQPLDYRHDRPTGRLYGRPAVGDGCHGPEPQGGRIGGPIIGNSGGVALGGDGGPTLGGIKTIGYNHARLRLDGGHPLDDGTSPGKRGVVSTTGCHYTGRGDDWCGDNSHRGDDDNSYHPDNLDNPYDEKSLGSRHIRLPLDGASADDRTYQEVDRGSGRSRNLVDSLLKPPNRYPRPGYGDARPPACGGVGGFVDHAATQHLQGCAGRVGYPSAVASPLPWPATATGPGSYDHRTLDGCPPVAAGGHARGLYPAQAEAAAGDGVSSSPTPFPALTWQRPLAGAAAGTRRAASNWRDDDAAATGTARPHMALGVLPLAVHDTAPVGATLPPRPRPPPLVRAPYGSPAAATAAFGSPARPPAGGLLPQLLPAATSIGKATPWVGVGLRGQAGGAGGAYPPSLDGKALAGFSTGPLPPLPPLRGSPWMGKGASGNDSGEGGSGSVSGGDSRHRGSRRSRSGSRVGRPHGLTTPHGGARALPHVIDKQLHRRDPGGRVTPVTSHPGGSGGSGGGNGSGKAKATVVTCGQCGNGFVKKSNLTRHIRTVHDGQRPFVCAEEGCGIRFAHKTHLVRHGKTHLPNVSYTCAGLACREGIHKNPPVQEHQMAKSSRANILGMGETSPPVAAPATAAAAAVTAAAEATGAADGTATTAAAAAAAAARMGTPGRGAWELARREWGSPSGTPSGPAGRTPYGANVSGHVDNGNDNSGGGVCSGDQGGGDSSLRGW
ncbi:hypothetical protein MMPV_000418 [Pyropia vietnamensis]